MNARIIDVHAHIFPRVQGRTGNGLTRGLGLGRVAMGAEVIQLIPPYNEETIFTPEMLLANMDWAGVEKALLLQGPFYGECNAYALEAIRRYPQRLAGAAYFDPWDPASGPVNLAELLCIPQFKAVKLECSEAAGLCGLHPQARLDDPAIDWVWPAIAGSGRVLVLDLGAVGSRSYQTRAVGEVARRHSGLKIVIAHLAQPRPDVEADPVRWAQWQAQIDLGKLPNVWFDCAALPAYLPQEGYPFPTARRYLQQAIERIGPQKVLWGSDVPGLLTSASYPQLVELARLHTAFLSPSEQERILWANAMEVFGFA